MKVLHFLILSLLLLPLIAGAQSVITAENFPSIGTTTVQKTFTVNSIQPGSEGLNQTWDFSGLQVPANAQPVTLNFVHPSETPYHSTYPEANVASTYQSLDGTFSYGYFKVSTSHLLMLGAATAEGREVYNNTNLLAKVPMTFGQESESAYDGTMETSAFSALIDAQKTMRYDGFGTLKLPAKTWPNTMRTKTVENRVDSIALGDGVYTRNVTTSTIYAWFVSGIANAVFEIRVAERKAYTYVPGIPPLEQTMPTQRIVSLQTNPTTPVITPAPVSFTIQMLSANPLQDDRAVFELNSGFNNELNVFVVNSLGQVLSSKTVGVQGETLILEIDLPGSEAGVYHICFTDGIGQVAVPVVRR